jgi:hypothetical protein
VQRNRNNYIGRLAGYELGQSLQSQQGQRTPEMCFVIVLEIVYQLASRIFIEKVRSRTLEMRRMSLALSTGMVVTHTYKWDSTDRAERGFDKWQTVTAPRADMKFTGTRDERAADMAERGEEKIEGGSYKRFHGHPISNQG